MSKIYREKDGQGKFIIRTHHTRTAGGQRIDGQLLKCEPNGGSDYCMHCGRDMCTGRAPAEGCKSLNDLAYGVDRAEEEASEERFYSECAEHFKDVVDAFGCDKEAKGGPACSMWCSREECAVSFKAVPTVPTPGELEYASWTGPDGVQEVDRG